MLHRHPVLSVLTASYLALVGWLTLTPQAVAGSHVWMLYRLLDAAHRRGYLQGVDPAEAEFLANVALFVPVGMFLLLLFGTRLWTLALLASFLLTAAIESVQGLVPGRVQDERDLIANGIGALIGVLVAVVLTLPAALRRRRRPAVRPRAAVRAGA